MFVSYQITWWQINVIMLYWTRQPRGYTLCIQQKCDKSALCVQQIDVAKEIKFRSCYMMFFITVILTILSTVQRRKWSPTRNDPQTGNDPQIGPQMTPNCKWSPMWTANDPAGKWRMAWSLVSWIFLKFFNFTFIFIYFLQLNDELDKHKEKIFWRRKL